MNYEQKKKLKADWSYFKPIGPTDNPKENISQMDERDVAKLLEIGDKMAAEL